MFSPSDCPAGQVFSTCAGSCPYSCEDLWPENQCVPATCSPGCSCPPGAVSDSLNHVTYLSDQSHDFHFTEDKMGKRNSGI